MSHTSLLPSRDRLGSPPAADPDDTVSSEASALRDALLDSRQRWREMVLLTADFAFETDAWGRFVFAAPDPAMGWPAGTLVGQPAELLLAEAGDGGFNPFRPTGPVRRRRGWLRRADGSYICLSFAVAPLLDASGRIVGARGVAQDMTEQDRHDGATAAALRRGELLHHIMASIREEVLAPRMMQAALSTLVAALGAEGCAVIDLIGENGVPTVLHAIGSGLAMVQPTALQLLERHAAESSQSCAPDGRGVLVCPGQTRFGERTGFAMWREPDGRGWDADEQTLTVSVTGVIRFILEHEAIQREMARQARTDMLTGLLNRRAFLEDIGRRLERLEHEGLPGTLVFVDLDNFKQLNDRSGHDAGDRALCRAAVLLRATVRPSDLVARFGGDEFALWLDGADEFVAAERAEALRLAAPGALAEPDQDFSGADSAAPELLSMSIGIASRRPGHGEDIDALIQRADEAMYEVKRAGRGHWRVSRVARA